MSTSVNELEQLICQEWHGQLLQQTGNPAVLNRVTLDFLERVGLPEKASDGAMFNMAFLPADEFQSVVDGADRGTVIGTVDHEHPLVIRESDGFVFIAEKSPWFFLNSSLTALLGCVAMYHREFILNPEDAGEPDGGDDADGFGTSVTRARTQRLRERLEHLDADALNPALGDADGVTYWGFVVEEIEAGII